MIDKEYAIDMSDRFLARAHELNLPPENRIETLDRTTQVIADINAIVYGLRLRSVEGAPVPSDPYQGLFFENFTRWDLTEGHVDPYLDQLQTQFGLRSRAEQYPERQLPFLANTITVLPTRESMFAALGLISPGLFHEKPVGAHARVVADHCRDVSASLLQFAQS